MFKAILVLLALVSVSSAAINTGSYMGAASYSGQNAGFTITLGATTYSNAIVINPGAQTLGTLVLSGTYTSAMAPAGSAFSLAAFSVGTETAITTTVYNYNVTWTSFTLTPTAGGVLAIASVCNNSALTSGAISFPTLTAGTAASLNAYGCIGMGIPPFSSGVVGIDNAVFYDILTQPTASTLETGFNPAPGNPKAPTINTPTPAARATLMNDVTVYTLVTVTPTPTPSGASTLGFSFATLLVAFVLALF